MVLSLVFILLIAILAICEVSKEPLKIELKASTPKQGLGLFFPFLGNDSKAIP